jgi:hypothetical protein
MATGFDVAALPVCVVTIPFDVYNISFPINGFASCLCGGMSF